MRIRVSGGSPCVASLRGELIELGYFVTDEQPRYSIFLETAPDQSVEFDSVDCPMEDAMFRYVRELVKDPIKIHTHDGLQSDVAVRIFVPSDPKVQRQVEIGVRRALTKFCPIISVEPPKFEQVKPRWKRWLAKLVVLAFCVATVRGQIRSTGSQPTTVTPSSGSVFSVDWTKIAGTTIADGVYVDVTNKAIRVFCVASTCSGGGGGGTSSTFGAAFPASGTAAGFSDGTNMQGARVFDADSGAGSQFVLGLNLRKIASGGSVEFGTTTDPIQVQSNGSNIATDRTTAGAPFSTRFSDGSAFYDAAKSSQLPGALAGNGGLKVECLSGCGGAATFADNSAFTFGTTGVTNIGAVVDDTATNTVTENSAGAPRMSTNRILYGNLRDAAGSEVGTSGAPLRTDPTGTTIQPVSGTVTANAGTNLNTSLLLLDSTFTGRINTQGQKAMSASTPVVLASDQSAIPVSQSGTWTVQPGNTANTTPWLVSTKTALTFNAPTFATVGVSSAQVLASNASRKGAVFVNTSNNTISCSVGQTAVLNSGVTLFPGGAWTMHELSFATGAVNCIASAASSNLSIQELQ
jgi:hypothetical protein